MSAVARNASGGSRQRKADELRAQMESPQPADEAREPQAASGDSAAQVAAGRPVGQGEHVVHEGECITSIAKQTGHLWRTIWDDAANAELRAARDNSNVLLPGDRVHVPPIRQKKEPGETEMRHRFVRRGEPAYLRLQVLDDDKPVANQPYELTVDGRAFTGTTDAEGKLEAPIPGNARSAHLVVGVEPKRYEYQLDLGEVDPVDALKGVQQRLWNLGHRTVPTDGVFGASTEEALRVFQKLNGLSPTGQADDATRQKLRRKHGC